MPQPLQIARERSICFLGISLMLTYLTLCSAQTCQWTNYAGERGPQSAATSPSLQSSLVACRSKCTSTAGCVAVNYHSSRKCELFASVPTLFPDTSVTFSVCETPTTTAAATTAIPTTTASSTTAIPTSTATPTTASPMTRYTGTTDEPAKYSLRFDSISQCESVCKAVEECKAYSYGSNTCKLYTSAITLSPSMDSEYATKTYCAGKKIMCCFTIPTSGTAGVAANIFLTGSTLESCEAICLALSTCKAVTFNSPTCSLYDSVPGGTSDGPITYSKKTVSGETGGYSITEACQGAVTLKISVCLPLVLTAFWTLFIL